MSDGSSIAPAGLTLPEIVLAVRRRRRELGLSQTELARMMGVSRAWVAAFEGEAGGASLRAVLVLLDVLGLPIEFAAASAGDRRGAQVADANGVALTSGRQPARTLSDPWPGGARSGT